VKALASGVILATGYMHVMPDSFDDLTSECLPDHPWRKFPFTTFIAMLSAILTLIVDSFSVSFFKRKLAPAATANTSNSLEAGERMKLEHGDVHGHNSHAHDGKMVDAEQLLRYRVVAQVSLRFNMKARVYIVVLVLRSLINI